LNSGVAPLNIMSVLTIKLVTKALATYNLAQPNDN
jgi:hypothetical protein